MSGNTDTNAESTDGNPLAPQGKNLLDNVSLMTTTLSPMPSQNTSLQRALGSGVLTSDDGKLYNKIGTERIPEEHEKSNISTLTAFEEKLHEHLQDLGSTAVSSTPATQLNQKHISNGATEVLYGFDLSPAHSVEKEKQLKSEPVGEKKEDVLYGFDLSPVHSYEKHAFEGNKNENQVSSVNISTSFEEHFKSGITEIRAAPNFMQAKVASPRQLRSEKTSLNEDTETMMSQVFSSQDHTSSVNGIFKPNSAPTANSKGHKKAEQKRKTRSPSTDVKRRSAAMLMQEKDTYLRRGNQHDYSYHSRLPKTQKTTPKKTTPSKPSTTKRSEPITPKSPKSRQTAVKVTPRIKSASKMQSKTPVASQGVTKLRQKGKNDKSAAASPGLYNKAEIISEDTELLSKSPEPILKSRTVNGPDSSILLQMVQDVDHMRSEVDKVRQELVIVSGEKKALERENELLKEENREIQKDNFVLKSKLAHYTSSHPPEARHDLIPKSKDTNVEGEESEISKLKQEVNDQDRLIHGYQQENERIYADLKKVKSANAETEHAMYEENRRLKAEIANLQEAVDKSNRMINSRKDGGQQLSESAEEVSPRPNDPDDIATLKKRIKLLEHEVKMEEGRRRKSEVAARQTEEKREQVHKNLMVDLCKKDELIEKLKQDHKVDIQTVQTQVDEAQSLITAGNRPGKYTKPNLTHTLPSKSLLSHFQQRVAKLEKDLEKRDSAANRAVQSVQQEYGAVKMKYEERINDLEAQIKAFRASTKRGHITEMEDLRRNNEALKQQLSATLAKMREESETWTTERNDLVNRMKHLQQTKSPNTKPTGKTKEQAELENRLRARESEVQRLSALLQEARQHMFKSAQPAARKKGPGKPTSENRGKDGMSYNPSSFEGEGYAGILEQNTSLKKQVENLSIELQHNKVINDALVVKLQQELKTLKENHEREITAMKQKNAQAEMLSNKDNERGDLLKQQITALEEQLDRCKSQVTQLREEKEETVILRIREQALQVQVQHLLNEARQAKAQSPSQSARKVSHLEDKLRVLEEQFRIKEESFRDALVNNSNSVVQSEFKKLQEQLEAKNRQLSRFQVELDSILLILNELQSQGVKIPLPTHLQSIF